MSKEEKFKRNQSKNERASKNYTHTHCIHKTGTIKVDIKRTKIHTHKKKQKTKKTVTIQKQN